MVAGSKAIRTGLRVGTMAVDVRAVQRQVVNLSKASSAKVGNQARNYSHHKVINP